MIDRWEAYWKGDEDHDYWKRPDPVVLELLETLSPEERPDVLDLGCGQGRHAIEFARAGFKVTATDISESAVSYLRSWAKKENLIIKTKICNFIDDCISKNSFDIVISINAIYHGYREDFAGAINQVKGMLRPSGLFFFTCPTRKDGKYGHGRQVAPHTYCCEKSLIPGDMHYFADEGDLYDLLNEFDLLSLKEKEGFWENKGERQFYSDWVILAQLCKSKIC